MKQFIVIQFLFVSLFSNIVWGLSERHIILIRSAEAQHNKTDTFNSNPKLTGHKVSELTKKGLTQAKDSAERLATHGFDNRNIAAVYVSSLPRAVQTAESMVAFGIFSKDKLNIDNRLNSPNAGLLEGTKTQDLDIDSWHISQEVMDKYHFEGNLHVRNRMLQLYDDIEKKHPTGHVLIIGHGVPLMELLQEIIQIEVRLNPGDAYLLPLTARHSVIQQQAA